MRSKTLLLAAAGSLLFLASSCTSTKEHSMSADNLSEEEMMARWMELGSPGEHHAVLDKLVGQFRTDMKIWETPDGEPTTSTGSATNQWIMGGRYLESTYRGEFQGMPFEGEGLTGYDNASQVYQSTWIDNFSTMMLPISEGTASNEGRTITFTRSFYDPMRGYEVDERDVLNIESRDRHTFEMYCNDAKGNEYKMMEIVYTRTW